MSIKIKELPELERPYEKLELYGEKVLSNAELLAIIIKAGTKEETSVQLAQKILNMNDTGIDDLNFLQSLSIEELMQIRGIGKVKAIQIKALSELGIRMSTPSNYKKITVKEPYDVAKILMRELRFEKNEIAKVVILNNKNEILKITDIAMGGTNFVNMSIKDVLAEPIKMKAPKIILVHNHPSGDSTPSNQDIEYTNRVYEISNMLGIELLDHLVIGDMRYTSIFSKMIIETKE
ncbi:MAG: DNA repair protein RadC [Clostridia bacterium]|nr:DNA repair protein RadC [Clostridia bacterium]